MSRYLGLDLASISGWAFFEDDRIIEKGSIHIPSSMELPQRLHFFHLELKNLLIRLQPERCFIEDVILGISGARTLAYLARINGVAINTAFEFLQERVKLYDPTYWKSHSFTGLSGMAKKWEIQLAVIKHYNLPITGNFSDVERVLAEKDTKEKELRDRWDGLRGQIAALKSRIASKRNPVTSDDLVTYKTEITICDREILSIKKQLKELEKTYDKKFVKISTDLTAQTGMSDNICDACGIAYCGYKETLSNAH